MDELTVFNLLEAVWWTAMAAVCWWKGRDQWKNVGRMAAILFMLFAATDIIEFQTGAWWKPWWLAVLKGICLIGLISCGVWAWQVRKRQTRREEPSVADAGL